MPRRILLSAPDVGELEQEYVAAAVRSGWVAPAGPDLDAFEHELAGRVGANHAVAVSSGTAALHLALLALGVGPDQVVLVPTLTFVATANAVVYTGAEPVFVDCDPATGNIDVDLLAELLRTLQTEGREVGAVMPVDMFGSCADYDALVPLCAGQGVPILEDAAEALGATRSGRSAGCFGRGGVFSFNGNKIVTTSSGGMVVSDDAGLAARCRHLANQARAPVAHYEHTEVGYNYRLSSVLAAIGRAQLRRLDAMLARRRALREQYARLFAECEGVRLLAGDDPGANCWLTSIVVDPARAGWSAQDLAGWLAARDIETRPVWKPMHLQPAFIGARAAVTGAAQRLFETGLVLPSGSAMDESETARVMDAVSEFVKPRRLHSHAIELRSGEPTTVATGEPREYDRVKRVMDVVIASFALILLAPVLAMVALMVRWDLGSPVLFRQVRPGHHGILFELVKFRTMRDGTGELARDAERLTPVGRWLRATSLDELPTLWNVVRGDMSLVGPRPLLVEYLDQYTPEQARRHEVRPGVTGLNQVRGRNALSWEGKLACDVTYVDQRSLWLDLRILLQTVGTVLRREGVEPAGDAPVPESMRSLA